MKAFASLAAVFLFLAIISLRSGLSPAQEGETLLSVPGIPGPYCAYGLEKRLLEIEGVQAVDLLWNEEKIRVVIGDKRKVTRSEIKEAIHRADYPYHYTIMP